MINKGNKRTLEECLQKFQSIHQLATKEMFMATKDVIKEFTDDGVKCLKQRNTPRKENYGMTEKTYVEFVLDTIKQSEKREQRHWC